MDVPSEVRVELDLHRLRSLLEPITPVLRLLRLVLRAVDLPCELDARLQLVEHVQLHRHFRDLFFLCPHKTQLARTHDCTREGDVRLPRLCMRACTTFRSSGVHITSENPLRIARTVRPFRCTYASAVRGTW